ERTLTSQLLREVDPDKMVRIKFDLSEISALEDDTLARAEEAATASRFWTVNEARAHTGQQPLEPGDERGEQFVETTPEPVDPDDEEEDEVEPQPRRRRPRKGVKAVSRELLHRVVENATRDSEEAMLE